MEVHRSLQHPPIASKIQREREKGEPQEIVVAIYIVYVRLFIALAVVGVVDL